MTVLNLLHPKRKIEVPCYLEIFLERKFLFILGRKVFLVTGLGDKITTKDVTVKRLRVRDPKYPKSPSAAFVKFDDRDSGNVYLVKVKSFAIFKIVTKIEFRNHSCNMKNASLFQKSRVYILNTKTLKIVKFHSLTDLFEVRIDEET